MKCVASTLKPAFIAHTEDDKGAKCFCEQTDTCTYPTYRAIRSMLIVYVRGKENTLSDIIKSLILTTGGTGESMKHYAGCLQTFINSSDSSQILDF